MRRNVLLGACLALALGIAGCQDQKTEPTAPSDRTALPSFSQAQGVRLELQSPSVAWWPTE